MKLNKAKEEWFKGHQVDLEALAKDVENWFANNGYVTQIKKAEDKSLWLIQARKPGKLRVVVGAKRAFSIVMEGEPNEFYVKVGISEWISNIASAGVAAIFSLGLTTIFIGASAAWSKKIQYDIKKYIHECVVMGKKSMDGSQSGIHLSPVEATAKEIEIDFEKKAASLNSAHEIGALDNNELQEKIKKVKNEMEISKKLLYLTDAKKKGVITEEEFDVKKNALKKAF